MTTRSHAGYTLIELLVVIAIISMISLITVPNLIGFYNQSKITVALQQFASDLRTARQQAITYYRPVKISFRTAGYGERRYWFYQLNGEIWTPTSLRPLGTPANSPDASYYKDLDEAVYFYSGAGYPSFPDVDNDFRRDIIFLTNGTLVTAGDVHLRTDFDNPVNQVTIGINQAGRVQTTKSRWN